MMQTELLQKNASFSNEQTVFEEIHLVDKNIVIYQRDIEPLKSEIVQVLHVARDFSENGNIQKIENGLKTYFHTHFPNCSSLLKDIERLLKRFDGVTKASSYRLSLITVNTNMCRRFHTNINNLRMLCTYSGQGTLWLSEDNINRSALDNAKDNVSIVMNENEIQQVKTGSVAILKGAIYPKKGTKAIVHRSPSIEKNRENRLLLRIDCNDFLSFLNDEITVI